MINANAYLEVAFICLYLYATTQNIKWYCMCMCFACALSLSLSLDQGSLCEVKWSMSMSVMYKGYRDDITARFLLHALSC